MKFTLYSYWRSSASWRVRTALNVKGVEYEYVAVHLVQNGGEQHSEAHARRNPMQQLPVLVIEGADGEEHTISQSLPIMELLDELLPSGPALLPRDLFLRARARQLAEIVNSGTQPLQNLGVITYVREHWGVDHKPFCQHWIAKGLAAYEASLEGVSGRFSVGDEVSVADICVVPQLYNARRFGVDVSAYPRLLAIEAACEELEAFQRSHPDQQPDADASAVR